MSKKYLKLWIVSATLFIFLFASLNLLVDPYLMFGSKRISGFNAVKPSYDKRERVAKAHIFQKLQPTTIILGNSRSQRGYSPSSQHWPESFQPVVNASLPGATIYEIFRYTQHAQIHTNLNNIFVTLEFEEFLKFANPKSDARYRQRYSEMDRRLSINEDGTENEWDTLERLKDYGRSLFSLDAVVDSVVTIAGQNLSFSQTITNSGFNPLREEEAKIQSIGHYSLFRSNQSKITANLITRARNVVVGIDYKNTEGGHYFEGLMDLISQHRLNAYFVIPPYHSKYFQIIDELGLAESFFQWQAYVTQRIADRNLQNQISFWNFSGFHQYNDEKIPSPGDKKTIMKWHIGPGHFKAALGEEVLRNIFSSQRETQPSDFGVRLNAKNIETHITTQQNSFRKFLK